MSKKQVAILGATSHIAKGLVDNFLKHRKDYELFLFIRSPEKLKSFLDSCNYTDFPDKQILSFSAFNTNEYDVIINCVGVGTPKGYENLEENILELTERFDSLVLNYLKKHPDKLYINFSSGAVYGKDYSEPISIKTKLALDVNNVGDKDFYLIAKLNSEAKHRALKSFNIVDLRVFSYFSRFIDLSAGFLLTELINCIKNKEIFITNSQDIVRDFVHPQDLFSLIEKIVQKKEAINDFYDVYSKAPIKKLELIAFFVKEYNLKYQIKDDLNIANTTGIKTFYYSINKKAQAIGYRPQYSSLECIKKESKEIVKTRKEF
jgi:nucleoside-diphosphate-sugar epimerase